MKFKATFLTLFSVLLLSGCDEKSSEIGCSSDISTNTLIDLLNKSAYKLLSEELSSYQDISSQNKRAALERLKFNISEISTTSSDKNSSLKSCEATVTLSIPSDAYMSVFDFYKEFTGGNLDNELENRTLIQNANTFSKRIAYTVQPTDDKKTVFVNSSDVSLPSAASLLSALTILKPIVEQEKIKQTQLEEAKRKQEIQRQENVQQNPVNSPPQEESMKSQEYVPVNNQISLSEIRSTYLSKDAELNAVWGNLSKERKKELLPAQRQWIKSKDAICGKTSMKGSDAQLIEMLKCQTEMTEARISELSR